MMKPGTFGAGTHLLIHLLSTPTTYASPSPPQIPSHDLQLNPPPAHHPPSPLFLPNHNHTNPIIFTPTLAATSLECFNLTTPETYPLDVSDCPDVIDAILHDPAGPLEQTTFSHEPRLGEYGVPAHWAVGGCLILLTSGFDTATDTFRLVDVIVRAQEIIATCPQMSKRSLGGLALIGNRKTFFVAVNGPEDERIRMERKERGLLRGDGSDDWVEEVNKAERVFKEDSAELSHIDSR